MLRSQTFVVLFAMLVLGLVGQEAQAQMNNLARIYFVEAMPGHGMQLEAAIKDHAQWRKQQGDPWTWMVMQVANGNNLGGFVIRSGEHSWADFDAYDASFGAKGGAHWEENVMPHVASVSSAITRVDTTNVHWPENPNDVNLISVISFSLKPGQEQAFTEAVSKIHNVIMEHGYPTHYAFEWTLNGPAGREVSLVLPFKDWSAMEGPKENMGAFLMRVMGQDAARKVFEQFDSTYRSSESMIIQVRRDLSVLPSM